MAASQMRGVSIMELAHPIRTKTKTRSDRGQSITTGLTPEKYPMVEGYHVATPAQMLSLLVPIQQIAGGEIIGFQRKLDPRHARRMAEAIGNGTPMPTIEVALHGNAAWITDGQHRAVASVIARASLPTLARRLNIEQMKELFASQARGKTVNPSTIVLSASDPFSEYVQDAVTDDSHPWAELVTWQIASEKRLTPSQTRIAVWVYSTNSLNAVPSQSTMARGAETKGFDRYRADQLAKLIKPFGTKEENPMAYRAVVFRALVKAAVVILRRAYADNEAWAIKRWCEWMPRFPFHAYQGVNSTNDYLPLLVQHWNKRLPNEKRVPVPTP